MMTLMSLMLALVVGTASWGPWRVAEVVPNFGPGLWGEGTACGHVLTRSLRGVAHRSLPCGTRIELRWHGHQVVTRVVDRGPYPTNYDYREMPLDLTRRTFRELLGRPLDGRGVLRDVRWRVRR